MSTVELVNIRKVYGESEAVRRLNFSVSEGEFFSLLGPSGCGKSTTLRMIAGFVQPTEGQVVIGGQDITHLPPEERKIGIVFQNYAIFPHMTVFDNIAYGLKVRKVAKAEIKIKVESALETVGLKGYNQRYQRELSGGEQQRVALARVLVVEPKILLLDEPLSALDRKMREEMKFWIKKLQQDLRITTVYVTHDQNEALTMSDRLAVMNRGEAQQVGTPREIYERPVSHFVTDFIGESSILTGVVEEILDKTVRVNFEGQLITAPKTADVSIGNVVSFALRPEIVSFGLPKPANGANSVDGIVRSESYQGSIIRYEISVGNQAVIAELQNAPDREGYGPSQRVSISWPEGSTALLRD